ncbi:hypothetical protein ACWYXN_06570 [Janthinobacterium aestuarii]
MTTFSTVQIPPPSDWNAFESLCRDLWAEIWRDKNAQKNGRSGQKQHGVDVFGKDYNNDKENYGIQCKGKDNYRSKSVDIKELESEIEKAKNFQPKLKIFIIATTGPKDVSIENHARYLSQEHSKTGDFLVYVYGWQDIKDKLELHPEVMRHHYKWLFEQRPQSAIEYMFEFWHNSIDFKNLKFNCNYLPFSTFDVQFSGKFINDLKSFLSKINVELLTPNGQICEVDFRNSINNFSRVAHELIERIEASENIYTLENDIYKYFVDVNHIQHAERAVYIEYKKGVVRSLFYHLVKSANYIVQLHNKIGCTQIKYIGFHDSFPHNFPLFGRPYPSPEYFPQHDETDLELGLYPGVFEIENYIKSQAY